MLRIGELIHLCMTMYCGVASVISSSMHDGLSLFGETRKLVVHTTGYASHVEICIKGSWCTCGCLGNCFSGPHSKTQGARSRLIHKTNPYSMNYISVGFERQSSDDRHFAEGSNGLWRCFSRFAAITFSKEYLMRIVCRRRQGSWMQI